MKILLHISLIFFLFTTNISEAQKGVQILNDMISESESINKLQLYTIIKERFDGKLHLQKSFVKVQHKPFKIYYRQDYPDKGIEILYLEGKNNNKALIHPNSFPWINLNLAPLNNQLRVKQHHTIFHPGFAYLISILKHMSKKHKDKFYELIKYKGDQNFSNYQCHKLEVLDPDFKYVKYKVKADETIDDIADKFFISSYMILEINKNVDSYTDIKEGQVIIIPNSYAKKMILLIDKIRNIPLVIKVYDDKGLYEQYEFSNIKLNVLFKKNEFSSSFEEYNF